MLELAHTIFTSLEFGPDFLIELIMLVILVDFFCNLAWISRGCH